MTSHCTFDASDGEFVEFQEGLRTREMQVGALCQSLWENFILCCEKSNGTEHKCTDGRNMVPVWSEKRNLGVFVCVVMLLFYSGILRSSSTWMWALPQFFFSGHPVDAFLLYLALFLFHLTLFLFNFSLVPGKASSLLHENSCGIRISICVRFFVENLFNTIILLL